MSYSRVAGLVSRGWLRKILDSGDKSVKVLDTSWRATVSGHDDFTSSHIPGATFLDLNTCVRPTPTLPRNLPERECFAQYVRSLGVSRDQHLVVYDRGNMLPAARAWWIFRVFGHEQVSVLNGGLEHWMHGGHPVETGDLTATDSIAEGDFEVSLNKKLVSDFNDVKEIVGSRSCQILDARKSKHFMGEEAEPAPATVVALESTKQPMPKRMLRGHIPGSKNLVDDMVIDPDTRCMHDRDELLQLFKAAGVSLDRPLTAMCYTSLKASLLALAAHECGKTDVSIYLGSWTEWSQRGDEDSQVRSLRKEAVKA